MAMFKYVLNHAKVKGSVIKLYQSVVTANNGMDGSDKFDDVNKTPSDEEIKGYFANMKKYRRDVMNYRCHHPISPEIDYLLRTTGKDVTTNEDKVYNWKSSTHPNEEDKDRNCNLRDLYEWHRKCE